MSLLSEFFVAMPSEVDAYLDAGPVAFEHAPFRGFTSIEVSELWSAIDDEEWTSARKDALLCVAHRNNYEAAVYLLPTPFVASLAALDRRDVEAVADKWVTMEEAADSGAEASDVRPVIEAASRLARSAQQEGKSLYFFMGI